MMAGYGTPEGKEPTWHDALLGYCGSEHGRRSAEAQMRHLGKKVGIELDYGVQAQWQPVDSQRAMLWAARFGKQELFMDALGRKHFEQRQSASHRATIIDAANEVGLDSAALDAFLDTDDLIDTVWDSYRATIHDLKIHAIPFFSFGLPSATTPFRKGSPGQNDSHIVRGSADPDTFTDVFASLLEASNLRIPAAMY